MATKSEATRAKDLGDIEAFMIFLFSGEDRRGVIACPREDRVAPAPM
jgi:hypothetical protein